MWGDKGLGYQCVLLLELNLQEGAGLGLVLTRVPFVHSLGLCVPCLPVCPQKEPGRVKGPV